MKEFVSSHRTSVVALVASMSVVSAVFVPYGVRWSGLEWASIALCAGPLLALTSLRSRTFAVEAERVLAVSTPKRAATSRDGAPLGFKGGRTP